MNHLDAIAVGEPGVCMLRSRHDLFIALDGNQGVCKPQRDQQLPDGCVGFHLSFFTVDDETHLRSVKRAPRRRKQVRSMGAADAG